MLIISGIFSVSAIRDGALAFGKSNTVFNFNITEKNNWLDAGGVKEVKLNKSMDVAQIHFEDGRVAEIHSCNPYGSGNGALVVGDLVSFANDQALAPLGRQV